MRRSPTAAWIARRVHHDQAGQRQPRSRHRPARAGREPAQARDGLRRSVPDPLAAAVGGQVRRDLAGIHRGQAGGRARSIGVSNFRVQDIEAIVDATGVAPAVNQIELHPRFQQSELRREHAKHGILTEAWSPLGQGELIDDETISRSRRARSHSGTGDPALAHPARQRRDPQVGHARSGSKRTSGCSTSSCPTTTCVRSRNSTPRTGASDPTRRRSDESGGICLAADQPAAVATATIAIDTSTSSISRSARTDAGTAGAVLAGAATTS